MFTFVIVVLGVIVANLINALVIGPALQRFAPTIYNKARDEMAKEIADRVKS